MHGCARPMALPNREIQAATANRFLWPTYLHARRPSKHPEPDIHPSTLPREKENTASWTVIWNGSKSTFFGRTARAVKSINLRLTTYESMCGFSDSFLRNGSCRLCWRHRTDGYGEPRSIRRGTGRSTDRCCTRSNVRPLALGCRPIMA